MSSSLDTVTLISKDNISFNLLKENVQISNMCKNASTLIININEVDGLTLKKVVEYMNHHEGTPGHKIPSPLTSNNMTNICQDPWDAKWIDEIDNISRQFLYDIINAAIFLDINCLLCLACAKWATFLMQSLSVYCGYCTISSLDKKQSFKSCGRCLKEQYCCRDHQLKAWAHHKHSCCILKEEKTPDAQLIMDTIEKFEDTTNIASVLRVITLIKFAFGRDNPFIFKYDYKENSPMHHMLVYYMRCYFEVAYACSHETNRKFQTVELYKKALQLHSYFTPSSLDFYNYKYHRDKALLYLMKINSETAIGAQLIQLDEEQPGHALARLPLMRQAHEFCLKDEYKEALQVLEEVDEHNDSVQYMKLECLWFIEDINMMKKLEIKDKILKDLSDLALCSMCETASSKRILPILLRLKKHLSCKDRVLNRVWKVSFAREIITFLLSYLCDDRELHEDLRFISKQLDNLPSSRCDEALYLY